MNTTIILPEMNINGLPKEFTIEIVNPIKLRLIYSFTRKDAMWYSPDNIGGTPKNLLQYIYQGSDPIGSAIAAFNKEFPKF